MKKIYFIKKRYLFSIIFVESVYSSFLKKYIILGIGGMTLGTPGGCGGGYFNN